MRASGFAPALLVLVLLGSVAAGCGGDDAPETETPPSPPPAAGDGTGAEPGSLELEAETLAGGLEVPWGLAFTPDGDLLVTERPGRVRLVRDGELLPEPVAELAVAASGEAGLLGIALHPGFPDEAWLYLYYTHPDGENRIARFPVEETDGGLSLGPEDVLLGGIPAARIHDGGRLAFGPDGMLYATTGDAGGPDRSADPESLGGKILRLTPDGSVPEDNPLDGSPVFSYGHRNPQGIAWDAGGALYASDHGPSGEFGLCCNDELTRVEPGGFHGWPLRAGDREAASPGDVGLDGPPDDPIEPLAASGDDATWAPGGIALHEPEDARASVLVAELAGQRLARHVLTADGSGVEDLEVVLDGVGRLRDVVAGPDGCFYALTSNRDGRGDPEEGDDRILRLCPR